MPRGMEYYEDLKKDLYQKEQEKQAIENGHKLREMMEAARQYEMQKVDKHRELIAESLKTVAELPVRKEYPWQYKQQEKVVSTENIKELLDLLTEYKLTVEEAIIIIRRQLEENSGL